MSAPPALHLDLDGAWPREAVPGDYLECRAWAAKLRYSTTRGHVRDFFKMVEPRLAAFTLYGSGDFHYLSALWLRRLREPFTLLSFDNHPDWDIRPPHWCCGTWLNRALELPHLRRAVVWGCGNFELDWPNRLFANHRALRADRLRVWPWRERISASAQKIWPGMTRENWRAHFETFAASLAGDQVYVTVDMDCLRSADAVTNWENGLFTSDDIAWALGKMRDHGKIVGGDLCGAYSPPRYARFKQRIEARLDHPKIEDLDASHAATRNARTREVIWPALTGTKS